MRQLHHACLVPEYRAAADGGGGVDCKHSHLQPSRFRCGMVWLVWWWERVREAGGCEAAHFRSLGDEVHAQALDEGALANAYGQLELPELHYERAVKQYESFRRTWRPTDAYSK